MAIKDIIGAGIGLAPGKVAFLITRGLLFGGPIPNKPSGLQYTLDDGRFHYTPESGLLHYTPTPERLHYTPTE